MIWILINC